MLIIPIRRSAHDDSFFLLTNLCHITYDVILVD